VERLAAAETLEDAAAAVVEEAGIEGIEATLLAARLTVPLPLLRSILERVPGVEALGGEPPVLVSGTALARLSGRAEKALETYHRAHPLEPGMPREELRSRVFAAAPAVAFERVLTHLHGAGRIRPASEVVTLASHRVELSSDEEDARETLLTAAEGSGLAGVEVRVVSENSGKDARLLERLARVLTRERLLDRVGEGLLVHHEHTEAFKREVRERWPAGSRLDVAAIKEMTGLSRKYVIPLLEYLDRERVTRRSGKDRVMLG
jgi:selenocysteine-specific elongation factor